MKQNKQEQEQAATKQGSSPVDISQLSEEQKASVRNWFFRQNTVPSSNLQDVILQIKNLDFTYHTGHHALHNINLNVHRGEMFSIVGTNGAGKSAFSKVI